MTEPELSILQTALDLLPLTTSHSVCVFCLAGHKPFWDEVTQLWVHRVRDNSGIVCRRKP